MTCRPRQAPAHYRKDRPLEDIAMTTRSFAVCAAALLGSIFLASTSAQALTMQECSAKYKAAQTAGTLKGMKWNDFRKAECGTTSPTTTSSTTPAPAATAPSTAAKPATTGKAATTTPSPMPSNAVFPTAVSPKYANEPAGKARMHTCLDQYNANKASNGNAGLTWIQKGGGYYSECTKRLKG